MTETPKLLPPPPDSHAPGSPRSAMVKMPDPPRNPIVAVLIWVFVIAILAAIAFFGYRYYQSQQQAEAQKNAKGHNPPVPVDVQKAVVGDMPVYIDRVGTVMAYNTVTLRSRVDGQLIKIDFKEGDLVHEGDPLFEIDPRPYEVQLTQAQGQIAKDQATLANAKVDAARYHKAEAAVSQQQIDTAEATVTSAEGTVKADQAAVDSANLNLLYCKIRAPLSGRIGLKMIDQGNMIHASDTNGLAVITQLQPISVFFNPTQDTLPAIQKAMAGGKQLIVEAWDPTIEHKLATGKLEALENQIDPTTGTVKAKAVFPNEDNVLYPNQFVNVRLLIDNLRSVVLVPNAAIQQSPTASFVYRVKPDNTVEMCEVKTGQFDDNHTVIESGINGGDEVVTSGVDKLEPDAKVIPHLAGAAQTQAASASGPASRGAHTRPTGAETPASPADRKGPRGGGRKNP